MKEEESRFHGYRAVGEIGGWWWYSFVFFFSRQGLDNAILARIIFKGGGVEGGGTVVWRGDGWGV